MKLNITQLEDRNNPSATVTNGVLLIQPGKDANYSTYGVVAVQTRDSIIVRERFQGHGTTYTTIPLANIASVVIHGQTYGRNVIDNRVLLPTTIHGGEFADYIKCSNGYNLVGTGLGVDTVVSLRGGELWKYDFTPNAPDHDVIYTHRHSFTLPRPNDRVIYV